ncbi:MAG TPA: fumarylacetoacetate hydrolase family protein [Solirubrobacterales bacterium]
MRLALFEKDGAATPAVVVPDGLVLLSSLVGEGGEPQHLMADLISRFEELRPQIEELVRSEPPVDEADGSLLAPLPRPTNILCCIANYWEHAQRHARPLNMYMKNPDAVIGPGGTIVLPAFEEPWIFMHEAELAIVIKGPAKNVRREDWRSAVFGFTGLIDVTARGKGRVTWRPISWMGKSFDTFAPVGPYITTNDDVPDPQDLRVKFWNDGQLRHDYTTDDMEHGVAEIVEFATSTMTLQSGDLIACGTNHEGLGALQGGERVDLEVERVGRMSLDVSDPLGRTWERGLYRGADTTNRSAAEGSG